MGSGKSTMAINHINTHQNKKFLCIVPLLKECERYEEKTNIDIIDPEKWGSKWKHITWHGKDKRSPRYFNPEAKIEIIFI